MIKYILNQLTKRTQYSISNHKKAGWMRDAVLKKVRYDKPMVVFKQINLHDDFNISFDEISINFSRLVHADIPLI